MIFVQNYRIYSLMLTFTDVFYKYFFVNLTVFFSVVLPGFTDPRVLSECVNAWIKNLEKNAWIKKIVWTLRYTFYCVNVWIYPTQFFAWIFSIPDFLQVFSILHRNFQEFWKNRISWFKKIAWIREFRKILNFECILGLFYLTCE